MALRPILNLFKRLEFFNSNVPLKRFEFKSTMESAVHLERSTSESLLLAKLSSRSTGKSSKSTLTNLFLYKFISFSAGSPLAVKLSKSPLLRLSVSSKLQLLNDADLSGLYVRLMSVSAGKLFTAILVRLLWLKSISFRLLSPDRSMLLSWPILKDAHFNFVAS